MRNADKKQHHIKTDDQKIVPTESCVFFVNPVFCNMINRHTKNNCRNQPE